MGGCAAWTRRGSNTRIRTRTSFLLHARHRGALVTRVAASPIARNINDERIARIVRSRIAITRQARVINAHQQCHHVLIIVIALISFALSLSRYIAITTRIIA